MKKKIIEVVLNHDFFSYLYILFYFEIYPLMNKQNKIVPINFPLHEKRKTEKDWREAEESLNQNRPTV